ncbi:hypothetical protein ACHAXA_006847 [Cyclostephanos tholiformis]|uniref:Phospholipid/glycerol acyltransferase domain-containing protein n=1 Tax=Cyclostephanos tholiformis TaxID=382380 RepID=A0ABD3R5A5_9STRA
MRIAPAVLSVALAVSSSFPLAAHAFVGPSSSSLCSGGGSGSGSGSRRTTTKTSTVPPLSIATEPAATETASPSSSSSSSSSSSHRPALDPEFQSARDASVAKLSSSLPSPSLERPLVHFVDEYFRALCEASANGSKNPDGSDITASQASRMMLTTLGYGIKYGLGAGNPRGKFVFEDVRHTALRGPRDGADDRYRADGVGGGYVDMLGTDVDVDFYAAGCDFFRPAMDLSRSLVLGRENLVRARAQLDAGENVVFLANHQSEADPQVVSCLFETVSPDIGDLAAELTYVAGHKVTTDPLAVPFSMGRNLLCIHSKKHIDADPATKPGKSRQNMSAMNSMLLGMKDGGMSIWVAPSGGRDRRDVSTGKIPIAPFDQKTVDMFRLMGNKSRVPTHFYPMSMVSYDLCPPPDFVEAGVGELRNVRYTPIGIAIGDEVPNVGGAEARHLFTEHAEKECVEGYVRLLRGLDMERYIP